MVQAYTGCQSKIILNSSEPPLKRSTIDRTVDRILIIVILTQCVIVTIADIGFALWSSTYIYRKVEERVPPLRLHKPFDQQSTSPRLAPTLFLYYLSLGSNVSAALIWQDDLDLYSTWYLIPRGNNIEG